jgi:hypothetical protein
MNYIPKNINSWERLNQLINVAEERIAANPRTKIKVLVYSPWNENSTKFKGYDARVNLFEVPEVMQILNETYDQDVTLNTVPTLITIQEIGDGRHGMIVTDNASGIQHELTSGG